MAQSNEQIHAVTRMQAYIEQHLREPITLDALAKAAGYSPSHCVRIFKEAIGKAPFDYIRSLRLSRAALDLRDREERVLDVAMDYAFDSHEGFTRAFRREFGLTPSDYSKDPPPIPLFQPYPAVDSLHSAPKEEQPVRASTIIVEEITRPKRKLLLRRAKSGDDYFSYCGEIGCDCWGLLCSVKEAIFEPMGLWLPPKLQLPGTSRYVQGVEVPADYDGVVPEGFECVELAPCRLLLFQGEPFEDEVFMEAIDTVMRAIDTFDPGRRGLQWADDEAPRFQLEPLGFRGYMEARPVKGLEEA